MLPDLVELYCWLHINLSYILTRVEATELTIEQIINLAKANLSKESGGKIYDLYNRVMRGYNKYVKLIEERIGVGPCGDQHKIYPISNDTKLIHFLSGI